MKKSMKLLSVLLTVLMIFSSVSVGASAAKASYQTVQNLKDLQAYSPYGTVTRLSTEERMSILFDSLDNLLAPMTSLNMGYLVNVNLLITKIQLYVNLTSVNEICKTLDSAASLLTSTIGSIAKGIVNLGIVEEVNLKTWNNTYSGMSRENTDQLRIVQGILDTLDDNGAVIDTVFTNGLELGMIKNFITGLDLSGINKLIVDLPKMINAFVLPLFSRPDDKADQRTVLGNVESDLMTTAQSFVNGLFTKPMSWTSYRVGADGSDLGYTAALPTTPEDTTRYFVIGDNTITQYDYNYKSALGKEEAGFKETVTYTKSETEEYEGSGTYLYVAPEGYNGDQTLKWYKADGKTDLNGNIQSSYWLPSVKSAFDSGALTLEINGKDSLAGLLYKFIPYIFNEMAPTVLNGSVKKAIASAFDVTFTKVGKKGSPEVQALVSSTGNPDNFFTSDQKYYTWEYTDYKVIKGVPYYRYQDDFFVGEIPNNISAFYNMINWDYKIPATGFMDKYIPTSVGGTSKAGYNTILGGLNDFVYDLIQLFINSEWEVKGKTVKRDEVFNWTKGDNSKLIENIKKGARAVFALAPEEILDEYYMDAQFYDKMMNGTTEQAVNGLICELVKLIMPQIKFSDDIIDQPMLAIGAVVVRELCTQLMPTYDFDAMIYTDYTAENRTMLAGKDSNYWLDTVIYMGVNLGVYYLRNLADLGEDDAANGYYGVMKTMGALPEDTADGMTFKANSQYIGAETPENASWLRMVDWIIDWALSTETEWTWKFSNIIDCGSTVALASYENPFNKLDTILLKLLPFNQLLNDSGLTCTYGSDSFLEKILKGGLVDAITGLDVPKLLGMLKIPDGVFTQDHIADNLVKVVVGLLNGITSKVAGGALIDTNTINSVDSLLKIDGAKTAHKNIVAVVKKLVQSLGALYNNGLLDTVLPIANFFIGWTVDPQKYEEPTAYITNDWGSTYQHSTNNPKLRVYNSSSGMLLTHRNSSTEDSAYTITISNVELTNGVSTTAQFPVKVNPGETADIPLTVAGEGTFKATITYKFNGKNGKDLGGERTKVAYAYVSDVTDQLNEEAGEVDKDYTVNNKYKKYEFTEDAFDTITNYTATVSYKGAGTIFDPSSRDPASIGTNGKAISGEAAKYFEHIDKVGEAGFVTVYKNPKDGQVSSSTGRLYRAKAGVTAESFAAEAQYGVYDMGMTTIKYRNSGKDYEVDFIYYNDSNIANVANEYVGLNLRASDYEPSAASAFETYEQALEKVVKLAGVAKRTDYVETVQSQIEPAIQALEEAYVALNEFKRATSDVTVETVANKLNSLETDPNRDINYQDYKLFEYFKYEAQRTAARNMIKSATPPAEPKAYIENDGASYETIKAVENAVTGKNSEKVKAAIEKTLVQPDMDAYAQELENYVPATHTDLEIYDQEAQLQYYYDFMKANAKTADTDFLTKEITYATNQKYDESKYSKDSWARYTAALAAAQEALKSQSEAEVFDAKYELMVAQNELLEKEKSMKENGYLDFELNAVISQANNIIDCYGSLYQLADESKDEAEAFAQLLEALGVAYNATGEGSVDKVATNLAGGDEEYTGILYSRSAITFQAYDRLNTVKNKKAVDAAAEKLRDAIKNFKIDVAIESTDANAVEQVKQDVRFIQGITPGSMDSIDDLLAKVECKTPGTKIEGKTNEYGMFGTGATVTVKLTDGDVEVAKYFVIIYGDVNGDGAVDGFDTFGVDKHMNRLDTLLNVYETAGDTSGDGLIDVTDYGAIKTASSGGTQVAQTK